MAEWIDACAISPAFSGAPARKPAEEAEGSSSAALQSTMRKVGQKARVCGMARYEEGAGEAVPGTGREMGRFLDASQKPKCEREKMSKRN